ncbi:MAG: hypothetical protein JWO55_64 [Candidatus Saccharibacteria bacterium]|jgi:hypothetical protein|nr:hypothetical protein [Candidatus Saccharibacteria bacterium]
MSVRNDSLNNKSLRELLVLDDYDAVYNPVHSNVLASVYATLMVAIAVAIAVTIRVLVAPMFALYVQTVPGASAAMVVLMLGGFCGLVSFIIAFEGLLRHYRGYRLIEVTMG